MDHCWRRRRRRGESLLEVLIAGSIFVIAFLLILGVFPASTRAVTRSRDMNFATQTGERLMEDMKARGYAWVNTNVNATGAWPSTPDPKLSVQHTNNGVSLTSEYIYSVQAAPLGSTAFAMTVTVSWYGDQGSAGGNVVGSSAGDYREYHSTQVLGVVGQ